MVETPNPATTNMYLQFGNRLQFKLSEINERKDYFKDKFEKEKQ